MARKLLMKWVKGLATAALVAAGAGAANAQSQYCFPHGDLVAELGEKFQEQQLAYGTIGHVAILEVFVGETGSWTIVITDVTGRSCIIAAGENWESKVIVSGANG